MSSLIGGGGGGGGGGIGGILGGIIGIIQAKKDAKTIRQRSKAARAEIQEETANILGAQRARFGKAGVSINVGTPVDVMLKTAEDQKLKELRVDWLADTEAQQLKAKAAASLASSVINTAASVATFGASSVLGGST